MRKESIAFTVAGDQVVGHLYLPEHSSGTSPAILLAGPMTSVKEQVTGVYAQALCQRGFVTLAIDHRHFGESGGLPRQYEYFPDKIADLSTALTVLKARPEVDSTQLNAVGICLGAGYMAHAIARRTDVRHFAGVAGYYRDVAAMKASNAGRFNQAIRQGQRAQAHYEQTGEALMIPAARLTGDAAMKLQSTFDYYAGRAQHSNYRNEFAVMSRAFFPTFDVQQVASQLQSRFLMIHGNNALNPDWAQSFYKQVKTEKACVLLASDNQTAWYDTPAIVAEASDNIAQWFTPTKENQDEPENLTTSASIE